MEKSEFCMQIESSLTHTFWLLTVLGNILMGFPRLEVFLEGLPRIHFV